MKILANEKIANCARLMKENALNKVDHCPCCDIVDISSLDELFEITHEKHYNGITYLDPGCAATVYKCRNCKAIFSSDQYPLIDFPNNDYDVTDYLDNPALAYILHKIEVYDIDITEKEGEE